MKYYTPGSTNMAGWNGWTRIESMNFLSSNGEKLQPAMWSDILGTGVKSTRLVRSRLEMVCPMGSGARGVLVLHYAAFWYFIFFIFWWCAQCFLQFFSTGISLHMLLPSLGLTELTFPWNLVPFLVGWLFTRWVDLAHLSQVPEGADHLGKVKPALRGIFVTPNAPCTSRDLFIPKRWRPLNPWKGRGSASQKGHQELPGRE